MFLDGTYPIYNAVTKGDINTVKKLIDKGAYIDPPSTSLSSTLTSDDYLDFTGAMSPLITAIYYNHQDIAKLLIEKGADLNTVIHSSYTPLITAIHKNDLKTMVLLLRNGANPEIADARFMTPLAHALYKDNIKAAELLIKNGADVNSGTDINFDTLKPDKALFSKEMNNNRFLDQKGELLCDDDCYYLPYNTNYSCPIDSGTPLHIAVGLNNLTATELLLKNKANVNETAIVSYYSKDGKAKNFSETVINYLGRASAHNKECVDYKIMEKGNISKITELLTKKGAAAPENKINPAEIYNNKKQEIASELKAIRNQEIKGKEEQKLRTEKRRKKNTPTGKYLLIGVAIVISGGLLFLLLNSNSKK